jgi:hypothetical protein
MGLILKERQGNSPAWRANELAKNGAAHNGHNLSKVAVIKE